MYTARRVAIRHIIPFAWKPLLFFVVYSVSICTIYLYTNWPLLTVPFLPIGTIGTAVAFYVGFKNNSSYARLWEGRQIWGALVNASRAWCIMVLDFIQSPDPDDTDAAETLQKNRQQLIYRHLAYLNTLRVQLRRQSVWQDHGGAEHSIIDHIDAFHLEGLDRELTPFLSPNEIDYIVKRQNPGTHLIRAQSAQLQALKAAGYLTEYYHVEMETMLTEFYKQQGACERIKSFPFPRQYAFFSFIFVWIFIILLPFGLLNEMAKIGGYHLWLTVPFYTLIAWVFNTMEVIGDTSENPFENTINDIPMTAICRNIEIDLREMLGETNLPPKVKAVENILM